MSNELISILKKESCKFFGYMKGNPEKAKSQIKGKILHEYKRDKINSFSKSLTKLNIKKDSNKIYSFILFLIICFSFFSQSFSSKKIELRRLNANNFINFIE